MIHRKFCTDLIIRCAPTHSTDPVLSGALKLVINLAYLPPCIAMERRSPTEWTYDRLINVCVLFAVVLECTEARLIPSRRQPHKSTIWFTVKTNSGQVLGELLLEEADLVQFSSVHDGTHCLDR